MRNLFLVSGGFVCVAVGLVFVPLPIPLGALLLVVGAALILTGSALARQMMKRLRTSNGRVHGWLAVAERYLPMSLRGVLQDTHPD